MKWPESDASLSDWFLYLDFFEVNPVGFVWGKWWLSFYCI